MSPPTCLMEQSWSDTSSGDDLYDFDEDDEEEEDLYFFEDEE